MVPTSALPTIGQKHNYDSSPTSGGSSATQTSGSGAKQSGSGSGTADTSAPQPTAAAADGLSKELKSTGAMLLGVLIVFVWL